MRPPPGYRHCQDSITSSFTWRCTWTASRLLQALFFAGVGNRVELVGQLNAVTKQPTPVSADCAKWAAGSMPPCTLGQAEWDSSNRLAPAAVPSAPARQGPRHQPAGQATRAGARLVDVAALRELQVANVTTSAPMVGHCGSNERSQLTWSRIQSHRQRYRKANPPRMKIQRCIGGLTQCPKVTCSNKSIERKPFNVIGPS